MSGVWMFCHMLYWSWGDWLLRLFCCPFHIYEGLSWFLSCGVSFCLFTIDFIFCWCNYFTSTLNKLTYIIHFLNVKTTIISFESDMDHYLYPFVQSCCTWWSILVYCLHYNYILVSFTRIFKSFVVIFHCHNYFTKIFWKLWSLLVCYICFNYILESSISVHFRNQCFKIRLEHCKFIYIVCWFSLLVLFLNVFIVDFLLLSGCSVNSAQIFIKWINHYVKIFQRLWKFSFTQQGFQKSPALSKYKSSLSLLFSDTDKHTSIDQKSVKEFFYLLKLQQKYVK